MAQTIKHLPTMQEKWFQSLGREDLLEKEMVTHSSILAWKIPWMEEPGRLQSKGLKRVRHEWMTSLSLFFSLYYSLNQLVKSLPATQETRVWSLGWEDYPGERNGNPLHYSCLENALDRGAWQATVYGIPRVGHNWVTKCILFIISIFICSKVLSWLPC